MEMFDFLFAVSWFLSLCLAFCVGFMKGQSAVMVHMQRTICEFKDMGIQILKGFKNEQKN